MDSQPVDRLIELALKWGQPFWWQHASDKATEFRNQRTKANRDHATARRMVDNGHTDELVKMFREDAERCDKVAEECHVYVITQHQELLDMQRLARLHYPNLLKLVPYANFFDPVPADLSNTLRDLRELEGALRATMIEAPRINETPQPIPPVVTLGTHPQVVLDGNSIALTYDQAHWLKALINTGDWMSDRAYNRVHKLQPRPDRFRKKLPSEVLGHVETSNMGSRWH